MLNVVLVWTGDKYGPEYLEKMAHMASRNLPMSHRLVVFTDKPDQALNLVPGCLVRNVLEFQLEGWWNKMLLFNWKWHRIGDGPILYLDLDMVVVRHLVPFVQRDADNLVTHSVFRRPDEISSTIMFIPKGWGSGVWGTYSQAMQNGSAYLIRGDQEFLQAVLNGNSDRFPLGIVASYRHHCMGKELPRRARVVSFHGKPDPHEVEDDWVKENWW